eukprot:4483201-Lingulodinium_polyedra.AAC.1
MEFPSNGTQIIDWLGRLEAWCATQPAGSDYLGLLREFTWLREAVKPPPTKDLCPRHPNGRHCARLTSLAAH